VNKHLQHIVAALLLLAGAPAQASDRATVLPERVRQGDLVIGQTAPGASVRYGTRDLLVDAEGRFAFAIGREQSGIATVQIRWPDGAEETVNLPVEARQWRVERVNGVPQATVTPPPAIAERIAREQALVTAARERNDTRSDFAAGFRWPVVGRISGVFGSQRIYNGVPKSAHSGLDVAAPQGTPIKAPAAGIVSFANADLYLTGGTVLIDHGHGISSNFLHLSRIDVKVGERVEQGQVIGLVGATGRATGPHMHWGMNWFDVRIDPQTLVAPALNPQGK
jgi:murein DD-endopeptidase MepM/ murein hydrolase activator NlpD